jgi:zinc transport system substrate-binding protein
MRHYFIALILLFCPLAQAHGESSKDAPRVIASIKPVHSLVASIMQGVAQPELLLNTSQSPHHYSLRPSERRKFAQADLTFWIGPSMESFMPRLLNNPDAEKQVISLLNTKGLTLLPVRHPGHNHSQTHQDDKSHTQIDAHIWLNTGNIKIMADEITRRLVDIDPDNKHHYESNNKNLQKKIKKLQVVLGQLLREKQQPFLTYHDGYQYFEHEFGLHNAGFVSNNPERRPSAMHIQSLRKLIHKHSIGCIFYDAPVEPPIIATLLTGNQARAIELDPMGTRLPINEQNLFQIMHAMGEKFSNCLQSNQ